VADAAGSKGGPEVLLGWTPDDRDWLKSSALRGLTFMAGYALAPAIARGAVAYLPARLSAVPGLLGGRLRPEVAVVTGVRRGGDLVFGSSVGWGPAAAEAADAVVVEVDGDGPDLGGPAIPGRIVATVERSPMPGPPSRPRPPDRTDALIGRHVAGLIPDGATLQFGPGGVADAVLASLDRPVRIWSGLLTDAVAGLADRGLLVGAATGAYAWGGAPLTRLAAEGRLDLRPVEETHDLTRLSATPTFVGCNTALQVGLDGSVNVERVAGRLVAGIGGHADFCAAAARSVGGVSLIALRSLTPRGGSSIVPAAETVSTPRCDVDVVVTEHGIADLRSCDDAERARRVVEVADPVHRPWLLEHIAGATAGA
jgi:acyl-CoA hydrolase